MTSDGACEHQADLVLPTRQSAGRASPVCILGLWRATTPDAPLDQACILPIEATQPAGSHKNHLKRHAALIQAVMLQTSWFQLSSDLIGMSTEAAHQFSPQANDWGFTTFATHQEVFSRGAGFVINDTLRMNVVVRVDRPEDLYYDSKKATGYVGLKNQGATCYMNSLLQTLYNINYFRQVTRPL